MPWWVELLSRLTVLVLVALPMPWWRVLGSTFLITAVPWTACRVWQSGADGAGLGLGTVVLVSAVAAIVVTVWVELARWWAR